MPTIAEEICFRLAKSLVLRRPTGAAGQNASTFDANAYQSWRKAELESQFNAHFSADLPDASADIILCFDVLEHILDYETIIPEWHRILRDQGHVLIWWMPYYHPYGHHVESLVPLPWAHAIFSERTVIDACARIYDMAEFQPRIWDLDEAGNKKPNKWQSLDALPTINKLTIRRFEQICDELGFTYERREYHPIRSSRLARMISAALIGVPFAREFITSVAIYDLGK